jgi:hypothetical protein
MNTQQIDPYQETPKTPAIRPSHFYHTSKEATRREGEGSRFPFKTDNKFKGRMIMDSQLDFDISIDQLQLQGTDQPTPILYEAEKIVTQKDMVKNVTQNVTQIGSQRPTQKLSQRTTQTANSSSFLMLNQTVNRHKEHMKKLLFKK